MTTSQPIGVVSAILVDADRPDHVLLGVRRPSELAPRHPGVLSTPTLRMPDTMFARLTADYRTPTSPEMTLVEGNEIAIGQGGHALTEDAFAIEMLMARKLGLADALVDGGLGATARAQYLSLDDVNDPLGTGLSEWTLMLTYLVKVHHGANLLPYATSSYSRLIWADAAKLRPAVANRDALLLDETLNAAEVCVHGLCMRVAVEMLADRPVSRHC